MMTSEAAGRKNRMIRYIEMQLLNILFSLAGVTVKFASNSWSDNGLFSLHTMLVIAAYVGMMAVYAFFWQRVIKKVSLSSAYLCKGLSMFWAMLWSVLILGEFMTVKNVIGALMIFSGTLLVNGNEK